MPDMRFAPPNPIRIADRAAGLNAVSVRSYNERLVLSMLSAARQHYPVRDRAKRPGFRRRPCRSSSARWNRKAW